MPYKCVTPDQQVLVKKGLCPFCKGHDIEGGFVEVDCDSAWQKVTCNDCGKSWNEVYNFSHAEYDYED